MISKNKEIAISVCVLTYNQQNTISRTIESILNQKFDGAIEILIGEDCSTDATLSVCKNYAEKYQETISLITEDHNVGLLLNVKRVVEKASGKYIAFCAGDDYWHDENKLALQYNYLESHPDYAMVYSSYMIEDLRAGTWLPFKAKNIKKGYIFNYLIMGNFISAVTTMCRAEYYKKNVSIGDYIEHRFMMEDFPAWLDLAKDYKIGFIDQPLATYQISGNSISCPVKVEKNLRFAKNVILVKKHYAAKFCIDKHLVRKALYVSNLQILGLVRRYRKPSDIYKVILSTNFTAILNYLIRR
jgi:glycosyltransferase involved in cell wall biosynthesis